MVYVKSGRLVSIHTKNRAYEAGTKLIPTGVLIHSTGANNPNLKRYVGTHPELGINTGNNGWDQPRPGGRDVQVHGWIGLDAKGDVRYVQTHPYDMRAWHAGGSANNNFIGIEICEDARNNPEYLNACLEVFYDEVSYMVVNGIIPNSYELITHSEAWKKGIGSNHGDITHWTPIIKKTMDQIRKECRTVVDGNKKELSKLEINIRKLVEAGIVNSPEFWINPENTNRHFCTLISNIFNNIDKLKEVLEKDKKK